MKRIRNTTGKNSYILLLGAFFVILFCLPCREQEGVGHSAPSAVRSTLRTQATRFCRCSSLGCWTKTVLQIKDKLSIKQEYEYNPTFEELNFKKKLFLVKSSNSGNQIQPLLQFRLLNKDFSKNKGQTVHKTAI